MVRKELQVWGGIASVWRKPVTASCSLISFEVSTVCYSVRRFLLNQIGKLAGFFRASRVRRNDYYKIIRCLVQRMGAKRLFWRHPPANQMHGSIQGGDPPKTYESNFIHHVFVQFGKQHSRYKAILPSILSQQCCEYTSYLAVVKP